MRDCSTNTLKPMLVGYFSFFNNHWVGFLFGTTQIHCQGGHFFFRKKGNNRQLHIRVGYQTIG
jgi:hypothetical protein